ncbi:hypothetical protein FOTG_17529 [Fusarium oxysporum f. sp. vasinfectum 25433]|uniref:C2H2-type domain-containing protein n=1 Tax=Fusarium oxysporum f. sp. vasinfectum 25433 TaxID=1089449 RepID=X0KKH9_FUSOX|nr:hypothetical protein FOTG_17529 [Fusarium oxysporum f. sp. vasinfectum 25433]
MPDDNETVVINENYPSEDNSHCCSQLSPTQEIKLQQRLREMFTRWSERVEYTTPPEDRLPPRKRSRTSQWESGLPRVEEEDGSEDDFVLVSHSALRRGFFHLACPFYIHAPDKHQLCLLQHDFSSIESLIKHLLRHHGKPLYCPTCRKAFETLIDRDNHTLENTCKRNDQVALDGLTEAQKARLMKNDQYYLGEIRRWQRIWSTVLPSAEQPRSPYLDRGDGLNVSMVRDFWAVSGRRSVSEFLEALEDHDDENCIPHNTTYQKTLEALLDWVVDQENIQLSYPLKDGLA